MTNQRIKIAVVGSGPAGLMAATRLSENPNLEVHIFEKRKGLGRKLLIAGSSGLNISHEASVRDFSKHYSGWNEEYWIEILNRFSTRDWLTFIEKKLGMETFLGTSDRYFVREMKASGLLKRWTEMLQERKVIIHSGQELVDFESDEYEVKLRFQNSDQKTGDSLSFDYAAFLLGGASWLGEEGLVPAWANVFRQNKIKIVDFEASNVGYEVDWPAEFLKEAEGKPLKKVLLQTARGKKLGELMVTAYGLEGTPIYFLGSSGEAILDLKPDLTLKQIEQKCLEVKENLSPIRRVKKTLGLNEAALALIFHLTSDETKRDLALLLNAVKAFPLMLKGPRPLSESISSKGGVDLNEVDSSFQLKAFRRIYCGGEMLDWDAPTGGFLIQASVSQGYEIAESILASVNIKRRE